ncbi:DUF2513 domain-containing protein [Verrucomicrobium sp. BvORR106]|uniref:DUF2513 domain-containing protein n=1 Tax=Verrucomicrobium sp. BvORR106 TaxID=1403819 RepID=UPI000570A882|nr:DUF2513 domain-containing protein [Verrucomicrobium sp. BvORR106]
MKRDLDLIRLLLLLEETGETPEAMSGYTEDQVLYHVELAIEAGLLQGAVVHDESGRVIGATTEKLTWEGHDFLDAARNETVWKEVQGKVSKAGGAWTFEVVKALLVETVRRGLFG